MLIVFLALYGVAIFYLFQRAEKTRQQALNADSEDEREMLLKVAKRRKRWAIMAALYIAGVIIFFTIFIFFAD